MFHPKSYRLFSALLFIYKNVTQHLKMTKFNPPISDRETEELIEIANCTDIDIWQREATSQAKNELLKRNISQEEQNKVIEKWNIEAEKRFKEVADQLEKNKMESYTVWEMIKIFLIGPLQFFRRFDDIYILRRENYFLKFKQRIIILILGFIAWFFFIYASFHDYQQNRIQEIEKVDISDWKKKHGYE